MSGWIALLVVGIFLAGSGIALLFDLRGTGWKVGRGSVVLGALFGNRTWLQHETLLGRFFGLIMLVCGVAALVAGAQRL